MVGDFNLPNIEWKNFTCKLQEDELSNSLIEKLRDCFSVQHVQEVTMRRGTVTIRRG